MLRRSPPVQPGAVLVTGASTGIGRAIALDLAAGGATVFAGVRKPEDAPTTPDGAIQPLTLDVTDAGQVEAAAAEISAAVGNAGLRGLVNNAGIAVGGPLEFLEVDELRRQFEVNLFGQLAVTQRLIADLRRAESPRIAFTSSIGGRVAAPMVGPYAASKHAVNGMAESLRRELRAWGIWVSVLAPGTVKTPIWDKGASQLDEELETLPAEGRELYGPSLDAMSTLLEGAGDSGIPPEEVAKAARHALYARRPKPEYLIGAEARGIATLSSLLPARLFDALVARRMGV